MEECSTQEPRIDDPCWDPRDKLAYLHDLRTHGVPSMPQNRGKLIDMHGNDRSDLVPEPPADGDLSPMLTETMETVAQYLDALIAQTRDQMATEILAAECAHVHAARLPFP